MHATVALPVAKGLAELEDATLHVVHVAARTLPPKEILRKLKLTPEELRGLVIDQLTGFPAAGIVREAYQQRSIFIVLCAHTGIEKPRGALGNIAREVLQAAACPVVLVQPDRGHRPWALRRLVLPHDGTPTCAAAIGPAADLARYARAELAVLHVASVCAPRPGEPGSFTVPRYQDQPQHEWPAWANEFLDRIRALGHPPEAVVMRLFLTRGEAGPAIVEFAARHESDLIALAWHGELGPERALTMQTVIGHASCPVIV
ncbi:MAG: hypothetical protein C4294_16570, partial [Nitrospiraceae bacterium]